MKGDISGSILCLVGPPGVGKTSIGHSIAEPWAAASTAFRWGACATRRKSRGTAAPTSAPCRQVRPGDEERRHREPGPDARRDRQDGRLFQGDPASALLEVLDPEQNGGFRDHYLDVPFDLSNVLFIATANQLDTIPAPLLDRMEIIRLSGYMLEEKMEIARRYLIPKALQEPWARAGQVDGAQRGAGGAHRRVGARGGVGPWRTGSRN